ncbi:hypothetical protein CGCF413_v012406 [Colletotrichum fructicola]|nr:hypothetical protein CGCF413_v012406 [Colletotrichum fructicola]
MHQVAEQNSGATCQTSTAANSKAAPSLPAWALAAAASTKHLSQPWKARYGSEPDDPNFTAEKDTVWETILLLLHIESRFRGYDDYVP